MPLFSIVIPTYNRALLISRAIRSVLNQTFSDWELIVVDDGSTDNTCELILSFLSDSRIHYVKKENSGAAHSRNIGAVLAKAEWLTFLDSDDEAEPGWLEEFSKLIRDSSVGAICCGLTRFDATGKVIDSKFPNRMSVVFGNVRGRFTNGGIFSLKKEYFDAIGGYDKDLQSGQHTELAIRLIRYLLANKRQIVSLEKSLIKIHIHEGERIRFNDRALYNGAALFLRKHGDLLKKDTKMLVDYINIQMVSSARLGNTKESKKLAWKALKIKPFSIKQWIRLFVQYISPLRKVYYQR